MQRQGYLTAEQYETAINTPITDGLQSLKSVNSYPQYMDNYLKEVIDQVEQETGYNLLTTGMEVYTNVDQEVQKHLWDVYNTDQYVNYPDDDIQAASTIIDVSNGKVIAQLGSRHQASNVSFGTNQAVETNRDWGSTMKPITDYAPALEYDIYDSTAYMLKDVPYNFPGTSTPVYNWDRGYYGNITLQTAIQQSRNVPAVETLDRVGLDKAKKFLNGLGIDYPPWYMQTQFQVIRLNQVNSTVQVVKKWLLPMLHLLTVVSTTNQCISIKLSLATVVQKSFLIKVLVL